MTGRNQDLLVRQVFVSVRVARRGTTFARSRPFQAVSGLSFRTGSESYQQLYQISEELERRATPRRVHYGRPHTLCPPTSLPAPCTPEFALFWMRRPISMLSSQQFRTSPWDCARSAQVWRPDIWCPHGRFLLHWSARIVGVM